MNPASVAAAVLALAAVAAMARFWLVSRRDPRRPHPARTATLVALQPLLAAVLYFGLFPPERALDPATLVVLTEGATAADAAGADGVVVALPEAGDSGAELRAPDLATALRQHPGTSRVQVLGAGLAARDREAARSVAIVFEPPPPAAGLTRLSLPPRIVRGEVFAIGGQVEGVAEGSVELHDPAGRRVDAAPLEAEGGFILRGVAMEAGAAQFALRVLDRDGGPVSTSELGLWIDTAVPPRVLLLAGAPGPETRALRRWLVDAGAQVEARIALGGGLQLGNAPMDAATLAGADLLIADARAWTGLGDAGRARILAAVRDGLGLLLRADTPMPQASRQGLQSPGFAMTGGSGSVPWTVPAARIDDEDALRARLGSGSRDVPVDLEQARATPPKLARRDWRVQGAAAVPFETLGDAPPGWWRAEGRGRIGVWTLLDSYVLPLHGRADLADALWSPALATVARARTDLLPAVDAGARVGERLAVCGWPDGALVVEPDGGTMRPLVDPASGTRRCAGIWPRRAGWHRLRLGTAERGFHVAPAEADDGPRRAALREATLALSASPPRPDGQAEGGAAPVREAGPAWPWLLAWMLLATLAWWLERSRVGLRAGQAPGTPLERPAEPSTH